MSEHDLCELVLISKHIYIILFSFSLCNIVHLRNFFNVRYAADTIIVPRARDIRYIYLIYGRCFIILFIVNLRFYTKRQTSNAYCNDWFAITTSILY